MNSKKPGKFKRTYWLRLIGFTAIVVLVPLLVMVAAVLQRQLDILVTPVRQPIEQTPLHINQPFNTITLTTTDNLELAAWHIPGETKNAVILVHGLNATREAMLPTAAILAEAGYHLLLLDLRGHGQSEGQYITYGYREALDVQAGVNYLRTVPNVEKIGLLGTSLGGAAVVRAAATDNRVEAVVVQSSYSSLPNAVEDAFEAFSIFPKWPFAPFIVGLAERRVGIAISQVDSTRDLATMASRPVLIIHSRDSSLFPLYHGQGMYNAAQEPKSLWIIESLGDDDPAIRYQAEYRRRVVNFFEAAFAD